MAIARNLNHPGAPLHPGAMLREEFMEPLGVSVEALASAMGVSTARMAEIVAEWRGISAHTARRLEKYFGMSARFWMNLQRNHVMALAYTGRTSKNRCR
jgi:addiction module HigA family antidote